jgi:hypothetical protein
MAIGPFGWGDRKGDCDRDPLEATRAGDLSVAGMQDDVRRQAAATVELGARAAAAAMTGKTCMEES